MGHLAISTLLDDFIDAVCYELQNNVTVIDLDRKLQYAEHEQVATDLEDQQLLWFGEDVPSQAIELHLLCAVAQTYTGRVWVRWPYFCKRDHNRFAFLGDLEKCGYNLRLVKQSTSYVAC